MKQHIIEPTHIKGNILYLIISNELTSIITETTFGSIITDITYFTTY